MIAHIFKGIGRKVGMTSTDGIVIDERLVIQVRRLRSALRPHGPAEPQASTSRSWRWPAVASSARVWATTATTSRSSRTSRPTTSACSGIDTLEQLADVKAVVVEAVPRQRVRGAQRRRPDSCARCGDAAPAASSGSRSSPRQQGARVRRGLLPSRRPRRRARAHRPGRHDRHQARPALDAARLDPPAALDVRRHGQVQRGQRHGRGGRGLRSGRRACTRSARVCAPSRRPTTSPPAA